MSLFVNPAAGDYHLRAGSPAVGAGVALAQVTDDLEGLSRPPGAYSIGCFEARQSSALRDFFPVALAVETGKLISGNTSSLTAIDGESVRVKAARLEGSFGDIITYDFQPGASHVASMTVTSVSRASIAPQRQEIMLYDFTTGAWAVVTDSVLQTTGESSTTVNVSSAAAFVSPTGAVRVQVRTGDLSSGKWKHFVDLLRISTRSE